MQGTYGEVAVKAFDWCKSAIQLELSLPCPSHRALAAITRARLENSASKVSDPKNIENNPMQSKRPPKRQLDPSGKSPAWLHHSEIL
jgi:hypothetical protein